MILSKEAILLSIQGKHPKASPRSVEITAPVVPIYEEIKDLPTFSSSTNFLKPNNSGCPSNTFSSYSLNSLTVENKFYDGQPSPLNECGPSSVNNELPGQNVGRNRSANITESQSLETQPWFHGNVSSVDAEALLQYDGEFLVHQNPQTSKYVLSLHSKGIVNHVDIITLKVMNSYGPAAATNQDFKYQFNNGAFDTIPKLIKSHLKYKIPVGSTKNSVITTPVCRFGSSGKTSLNASLHPNSYLDLTPSRRQSDPFEMSGQAQLLKANKPIRFNQVESLKGALPRQLDTASKCFTTPSQEQFLKRIGRSKSDLVGSDKKDMEAALQSQGGKSSTLFSYQLLRVEPTCAMSTSPTSSLPLSSPSEMDEYIYISSPSINSDAMKTSHLSIQPASHNSTSAASSSTHIAQTASIVHTQPKMMTSQDLRSSSDGHSSVTKRHIAGSSQLQSHTPARNQVRSFPGHEALEWAHTILLSHSNDELASHMTRADAVRFLLAPMLGEDNIAWKKRYDVKNTAYVNSYLIGACVLCRVEQESSCFGILCGLQTLADPVAGGSLWTKFYNR